MSRDTQKPTGWQLPDTQQATLRDLMAMSALQGLLANAGGPIQSNSVNGWNWTNCNIPDVAVVAYDVADAMMAERARRMGVSHE